MPYRSLQETIADLEPIGQLVRIKEPVEANLEIAEIQRRLFCTGGPAVLFERVRGTKFPMLANLYGTLDRVRHLFRDTIGPIKRLARLQVDPADLMRRPRLYLDAPLHGWRSRPKRVRTGPVMECETTIDALPQLVSWPEDGGAYITLPQVYTEDPDQPGFSRSNLGMYRVQLSGGEYETNHEVGAPLPAPPWHCDPPRGSDPTWRAVAGQYFRWRTSRDERGGCHADARGDQRVDVRRCTRWASGSDDRGAVSVADGRGKPIFA